MNKEESVREPSVRMNHLSPWDMSGLGMGFGLYRPRRPSYTYATQTHRQRSESYRYAVRKSTSDIEEPADFIEGVIQRKNRKESYILATRVEDPRDSETVRPTIKVMERDLPDIEEQVDIPTTVVSELKDTDHYASNNVANEMNTYVSETKELTVNNIACASDNHIEELKAAVSKRRSPNRSPYHHSPSSTHNQQLPSRERNKSLILALKDPDDDFTEDSVFVGSVDKPDPTKRTLTPCSENGKLFFPLTTFQFKKNLILLCASFILLFSAFRAIQNLQSSLNNEDNLGIIAMSCVHGTMFLTCLWAPAIINTFTAKWTLSFGMFSFIMWIGANFYPRFYTLIPFGIIAGMGQGILWTAESSYLLKLAFDSSRVTKDGLEREVFRFHGIFLACFQTTHIWGNLISSIVLSNARKTYDSELNAMLSGMNITMMDYDVPVATSLHCGVLYPCQQKSSKTDLTKDVPSSLWQLMTAYISLALLGFCLVLLCLDKIGAKVEPEKSGYEIVVEHVSMILTHRTFRLLVPLLIFSGLQQGFAFSDFTQAYITCAMGEEYIGYCMIILGVANVASAILVALCANLISREVVFGIGGIIHMGLMIGLLIWIPDKNLAIFFILSASWGLCDAVWQTQCNTLICITCPENTDSAFANYRMLQSFGLTMGFLSGTYLCVSFKLYILMILLVVAIMFYVLAEYKVRQVEDETFEENIQESVDVN